MKYTRVVLAMIVGTFAWLPADAGDDAEVKFNRDIRPILSDNCFVCHGPDSNLRKADLRLDVAEKALADRGGYHILAPGKPKDSELFVRVTSTERSQQMPPPKSKKQLTKQQIQLLERWIEQGAKYEKHWSFIAPVRVELPEVKNKGWVRNPIDQFLLARMQHEKVQPSAEADKRTLIRRLSFDLRGLPPSPEEVDAFVADAEPRAYERLVERLLASPHFGERMAEYWLDLVRFADTGGYHSDNHRDLYLYRDYVINAFNKNLPYDKFLVEQLAGDLLPKPTQEQLIATGYNRLLQTTEEGGAQAKEYQAKYYADRVRNLGSVWLGLTLGCAECHDHKFDPVATKEFYQLQAFFADVNEKSVGRQAQTTMATPEQQMRIKHVEAGMAPLKEAMAKDTPELRDAQAEWEADAAKLKALPKNIAAIVMVAAEKRTPVQRKDLADYFRSITPLLQEPREKLAALEKQKAELDSQIPSSLITVAMAPRTIRVLPRGNWLDDSGEIVMPDMPASLPDFPAAQTRRLNRLDLATWMTAPENPLVARVFVNRLWMLFFGQGIVKSMEDFGAQGTWPTHPELLDWLAVEFRDSGWNVQHMITLLVTSNAYRQTSTPSEQLRQRDPYNKLYARQARYRLEAEMVRDNALAISGLLTRKIGGPSVKPYQPDGYWQFLNFPKRTYAKDTGPDQYRRGLYTYWQRSFLHPSLLAFDAPSREECTVERPRSNTPQQALVLLNDPTYVEAARAFAENIVRKGGAETEGRMQFAFRQALNRRAQTDEVKLLTTLYGEHRAQYEKDAPGAAALLSVGDHPAAKDIAAPELAAWTSVARVILNLHETITRE